MKKTLLCLIAAGIVTSASSQGWVRLDSTAEKLVCVIKINESSDANTLKSCNLPSLADILVNEEDVITELFKNIAAKKDSASKDSAPINATPKDLVQKEAAQKDEAQKDEALKDEALKDEAPKDEAPKDEAPKDKTPKDKTPKDAILLIYHYTITERRIDDQNIKGKINVFRTEMHLPKNVIKKIVLFGGLIEERLNSINLELAYNEQPKTYSHLFVTENSIDQKMGESTAEIALQPRSKGMFTRSFFDWKGNPKFFLSASYQLGFSYRILVVRNPSFTGHELLDQRQRSEKPMFQHYPSILFGIKLGKNRADYFTIKSSLWKQGFKVDNGRVNWQTGNIENRSENSLYTLRYFGIGPGYAYTRFKKKWSTRFATGLMFMWLQDYEDPESISLNDASISSINTFSAAIYAELGCNLRLSRRLSGFLGFHANQNFTRLHAKDLSTYPNNLSVIGGAIYHLGY